MGVWIYIWIFNLIPLINLSFLLLVPCSFYYDSSLVHLGLQYLRIFFYYIGHPVVLFCFVFPSEFEYCSFKVCKVLCWNFDGDCIKSVDCFWWDGHFYINSTDLWAWEIFLSSEIFNFFSSKTWSYCHTSLSLAWLGRFTSRYLKLFVDIVNRCCFPGSFQLVICI